MDSGSTIHTQTRPVSARKPATVGMLCAVAYVAMLVGQIVPEVGGFLSYDPKDVVVVIGGFIYGPLIAAVISLITSFLEMITVSHTQLYGFVMNVFSTCAFAVPASLLYKHIRSAKGAIAGLVAGVAAQAALMALWNWLITPHYLAAVYTMELSVAKTTVAGMMLGVILPFNLVKGTINAGLTMLLYKPVVTGLRKAGLVPASTGSGGKGRLNWGMVLLGAALTVAGVLLIMRLMGLF